MRVPEARFGRASLAFGGLVELHGALEILDELGLVSKALVQVIGHGA